MTQIIPAILATKEEDYSKKLKNIEESGQFEWVQIDLMDNKFVQNKSIGTEIIAKYKEPSLKIEAHLMVQDPLFYVEDLIKIGVKRVIIPIEIHFKEIDRILYMVKDLDIEFGLSLNPETEVSRLDPFLDKLDVVLIMSVHPGFQGQKFVPETLEKVKDCARMRSNNNLDFQIEVDGGVSEKNAKGIVESGADILVIGSALYKYDTLKEAKEKFLEAAK